MGLRDYPHAAGRLSNDPVTKTWWIELNNEGIPFSIGSTQLHSIFSDKFNHESSAEFIDPLPNPIPIHALIGSPLVKFKLVTSDKAGETSLGLSWLHALGTF